MPQYLILADDYKDAYAIDRRLAVREAHLARMSVEKAKGNFVTGGAKLDDEGKMIGSMLVINAATEDDARQWVQADPYITGKVWEKVEFLPFKVATVY
jgi:uncharacterized protein YciI